MYKVKFPPSNGTQHSTLHPKLPDVLKQVFYKRPALRYLAHDCVSKEGYYCSLDIYEDVYFVGNIKYEKWTPWRGEPKEMFQIKSPNIRKQRHPSDTVLTTSAKKAIDTLLDEKLLCKPEMSKLCEHLVYKMQNGLDNIIHNKRYDYKREFKEHELYAFLTACGSGSLPDLYNYPSVKKTMSNPMNISVGQELDVLSSLSSEASKENFYVVVVNHDESISVYNAKDKSLFYKGNSTYDLPEWMQSKFAILKNIEDKQSIRNMGWRCEDMYAIIDGEIPDLIQ